MTAGAVIVAAERYEQKLDAYRDVIRAGQEARREWFDFLAVYGLEDKWAEYTAGRRAAA